MAIKLFPLHMKFAEQYKGGMSLKLRDWNKKSAMVHFGASTYSSFY